MVITPASDGFPADTATIKIKKFAGGSPREWLRWSNQFRRLARKKQWTDEQKAHNMVALIDGDLATEVEVIAQDAVEHGRTFEQFFTDVGLLSVPHDYSEDLDNELWTMVKRRDETVLKFSQRLRENIRLFAELPQNAEEIPEVQQCRYFKRGMPYRDMVYYLWHCSHQRRTTRFAAQISRADTPNVDWNCQKNDDSVWTTKAFLGIRNDKYGMHY
uniref:Uncharacterized protein n=1 Tax=Peronospora matthiolae TaxID=2874970 RepID=A0AAV1UR62_9STRA